MAIILLLCALFVPPLLGGGCGASPGGSPPAADETEEPSAKVEPRRVEVASVRRGLVRDTLTVSTTLEALSTVDVPALVEGRVQSVMVREGDDVRAGDVLLRLDPTLNPAVLYAEGNIFNFGYVRLEPADDGSIHLRSDIRDELGQVRFGSTLDLAPE